MNTMTRPEPPEIDLAEHVALPASSTSTESRQKSARDNRGLFLDLLCALVLVAFVLLPFSAAFQPGKTVSSIGLLKEIDYLQDPSRTEPFFIKDDQSASLLHIPNEIFYKQSGSEIPLWNPLNGAGRPFIGDFQTLLFSFFHTFFPADNASLYNWAILSKLVMGALGAYCLARFSGLSRISSLMIGQAFVLCGRSLNLLELCDNACFYPWSVLLALWATSKKTIHRPALFALYIAALAYNMHPETFFCAASVGYLVLLLRAFSMENGTLLKRSINAIVTCFSSATISLLVAAPLLLTFVEFIKNGMSYKFQDEKVAFVSLWSFVSESFAAYDGTGCYVGAAVALLLPVGAFLFWKKQRELAIVAALTFIFTTRPGALESILSAAPFSYFLPTYSQMMMILLVLLSAGMGMDALVKPDAGTGVKKLLSNKWFKFGYGIWFALGAAFFSLQMPIINNFICDKTDFIYDCVCSDVPVLLGSILSLVVAGAIIFSLLKVQTLSASVRTSLLAALALTNMGMVEMLASHHLPVNESTWYKRPAIIDKLAAVQENSSFRSIASSYDLYIPCANMIFGLDNFGSTSPLHPTRYANYSRLMGLRDAFCNIAECPREVNHLFSLASIKYIVSKKPLTEASSAKKLEFLPAFPYIKQDVQTRTYSNKSDSDPSVTTIEMTDTQQIYPALRLNFAKVSFDFRNRQVDGFANLTIHQMASRIYNFQISLRDADDNSVWSSYPRREQIEDLSRKISDIEYQIPIAVSIPQNAKAPYKLVLTLTHGSDSPDAKSIVLAQSEPPPGDTKTSPSSVKSIYESEDGVRLYENSSALPNCYIVHNAELVSKAKDSLNFIKSPLHDWKDLAVIEVSEADKKQAVESKFADGFEFLKNINVPASLHEDCPTKSSDRVRLLDKSSNVVTAMSISEAPSFLILTDTFYPGWHVTVDGKPSHIFAANHAFRAVYLPAGRHFISFEFKPSTLDWRLMIAGLLLGFGAVVVGLLLSPRSKKN